MAGTTILTVDALAFKQEIQAGRLSIKRTTKRRERLALNALFNAHQA
jgi:hypothetical protein